MFERRGRARQGRWSRHGRALRPPVHRAGRDAPARTARA